MKTLKEQLMNVNEARQIDYRVAFLETKDEEEFPYVVTILVDKEYQRDFENFLNNEQDKIFYHVNGGNVEY